MEDLPKQKGKPKPVKKQSHSFMVWPIKVLILSFSLSMLFGILSEMVLSGATIVLSVIIILIFVFIAMVSDMIGVAITASNAQPFRAMASKKVRGAKEALKLLAKSDRVSSICCDVIGDVCGILAGAAGASISVLLIVQNSNALNIIIASLVSATVASLTIFAKALGKKYSINNSEKIVLMVGKFFSLFAIQKKKKNYSKTDNKKTDREVDKTTQQIVESNSESKNNDIEKTVN